MDIVVTGATGRMGWSVIETLEGHDSHRLVGAVGREAGTANGYEVLASDALDTLLPRADVVIDFTAPAATVRFARSCAQAAVPLVTGTTGLSAAQQDVLTETAASIPVLSASNFSVGLVALKRALQVVTRELADYDVELLETHHHRKADAPSGTALDLLETISAGRDEVTPVHGREGDAERAPEEIGVFARRAGDIRGVHEVLFAGNDEELSLTHRVGSRRVFAAGALAAAEWIAEAPSGRYSFEDVLA